MNQKGFALIIILAGILILAVVAGGAYYFGKSQSQNATISQTSQAIPSPSPIDETANWKTHINTEGNYSFQYPSDWVVEIFKGKYPYNAKYDKAHVVFQSRATTAKEKADDAPGLPVDMAGGSIKIITTESMKGTEYSKMSEQDFFKESD